MRDATGRFPVQRYGFRNALVIKVRDLFAEVEILQQCWSALASLKGILIIADFKPLIGGQVITGR